MMTFLYNCNFRIVARETQGLYGSGKGCVDAYTSREDCSGLTHPLSASGTRINQ